MTARPKSLLVQYLESIIVATFLATICKGLILDVMSVGATGMRPTIEPGGYRVLVWRSAYGLHLPLSELVYSFRLPQRGDIVTFQRPGRPDDSFVQRVVGLPGDSIEVRSHIVIINGLPVKRADAPGDCRGPGGDPCKLVGEELEAGRHVIAEDLSASSDFGPVTVPANHLFVMGDNRDYTADSRVWGTVPVGNVRGRVIWHR